MEERDLSRFKKQLIKEKERIILEKEAACQDDESKGAAGDHDRQMADAALHTYDLVMDETICANFDKLIEQIDFALAKIENGTYGKCDSCGIDIKQERLKALPYATLCIDCKEQLEG